MNCNRYDKGKKKGGRRELTYVIQGWWKLDYRLYGDVVDSLRSSATGTPKSVYSFNEFCYTCRLYVMLHRGKSSKYLTDRR